MKNRLFVFGNFENEERRAAAPPFRANNGGEPVGGNVTRVLASDLTALSAFLKTNFDYDTGAVPGLRDLNAGRSAACSQGDFNLNASNKISFRYTQLDSSTDIQLSELDLGSASAAARQPRPAMNFQSSNYEILENRKSGDRRVELGDRQHHVQHPASSATRRRTRAARAASAAVPVRRHPGSDGTAYTSFGFEPFTPNNELRYKHVPGAEQLHQVRRPSTR